MLYTNNFFDTLITMYFYIFIYNVSLTFLFWTFFQFINSRNKTIFSFNDFSSNIFYTCLCTTILLSLGGIPPLMGFFSKLLILILLSKSMFFLLFIFFFILLYFGLYFYLQNIRYLHSTNKTIINYSYELNTRTQLLFVLFSQIFLYIQFFGFLYIDDFILYFTWLFN